MASLDDYLSLLDGDSIQENELEETIDIDEELKIIQNLYKTHTSSFVERDNFDTCKECGGNMTKNDLQNVICETCGIIVKFEEMQVVQKGLVPVKCVGINSSIYQSSLYSGRYNKSEESHKQQIMTDLNTYHRRYKEKGKNPFPDEVIHALCDYLYVVQMNKTIRSRNRRRIIGCLLFKCCIQLGCARSKADISEFMNLNSNGLAISSMDFIDGLPCENIDSVAAAHINTALSYLDWINDEEKLRVKSVVAEALTIVEEKGIGINSQIKSRVYGMVCITLARMGFNVNYVDIFKSEIQKNTLVKFISSVTANHKHFKKMYKNHRLITSSDLVIL